MVDYIPVTYIIYNNNYEAIDCNHAAVSLFAKQMQAEKFFEDARLYLIRNANNLYANYSTDSVFVKKIIENGCTQALRKGFFQYEQSFSTLSGEVIPFQVTVVPIKHEHEQCFVYYMLTKEQAKKKKVPPDDPGINGKVLVVDDVEMNLMLVQGILEHYGLKTETAQSGQEAIDKVTAGAVYDIIFMDHVMPGMDGIVTTNTLRAMGYKHPILSLTGNTNKKDEDLFTLSSFDGFIGKPINKEHLEQYLIWFIYDKYAIKGVTA